MLRSKKGFIIITVLTLVIFGVLYFYFHFQSTDMAETERIVVAIMAACAPAGLFTIGPAIISFGSNIGGIFDASVGRFIGGVFGIIFGAAFGMIVFPICLLVGLIKLFTHGFDKKVEE